MKLVNREEFLKHKKSDTVVIYGSGPSIKDLTLDDKKILNQFDSIGFNCFSRTGIETTYYIIGEMIFNYYKAMNSKHRIKGESVTDIFKDTKEDPESYLNTFKEFTKTCYIVWDDKSIKTCPSWTNFTNTQKNDYIYVKQYGHDIPLQSNVNGKRGKVTMRFDTHREHSKFIDKIFYTQDLLLQDNIFLHSLKGTNGAIYVAKCLGYKNVIFSGVDLGNYGPDAYAFDRSQFVDKFISQVRKGSKTHPCKELLFKFINYLKNDINFYTYSPKSMLTEIIPVYRKDM